MEETAQDQFPEKDRYRCVVCGKKASALYRLYGTSVLKLNKCKYCRGIVDKFIELDTVIVILDLILISKEAQRHVIFNTEFKAFWKIFLVCALLETYGVWNNDSLFNIGINSLCRIKTDATINYTYLDIPKNQSLPSWWVQSCLGWMHSEQGDRYIWEQDFYINLCSTLLGIAMFLLSLNCMVWTLTPLQPLHWRQMKPNKNEASFKTMLKAFSMAYASTLFSLPMMVWGNADTSVGTRAIHYLLGHIYSFAVFFSTFNVVYEESTSLTVVCLMQAFGGKYLTMFVATPMLQHWMK